MGAVQLKADKACIDKELGCEIPEFIYEEAKKHAELKQAMLLKLGCEHVKEPFWMIKITAEYVNQIFDIEKYKQFLEE